jgi:hypothetical protein
MNRNFPSIKSPLLLASTLIICWLMPARSPAAVGYVNTVMTNGYNFVANPLNYNATNSINNVIPSPPDGTRVWLWNVTDQVFDPPSGFNAPAPGWSLNLSLPPGRGFVVHTLAKFTNTFVGQVLEGALTNFVAGNNRLSLLGSKVPIGGPLATAVHFPGSDGDIVSIYPTLNQRYLDGYTYFLGFGWFDPQGAVDTNGPVLPVAGAFFVRHRGPDTNWVRNFTVSFSGGFVPGGGSSPPQILGLTIQNGVATLRISESDLPFNVQFSTNRVSWTTIAVNQTGSRWTGTCPSATAGFFQLIAP